MGNFNAFQGLPNPGTRFRLGKTRESLGINKLGGALSKEVLTNENNFK